MSYYYRYIPDIVKKLYDRYAYLEQWEYDTMIEWCRGNSREAINIQEALKTARNYWYPQFKFVKRVTDDEYYYSFGW